MPATYVPKRPEIVAVTIDAPIGPKLMCVDHLIGIPKDLILGEFEQDDLEPGEKCQAYGCEKVLGVTE